MEIFQKKFKFFSQILKNRKNQIFCRKRLQTLAQNVHEGKTKVKLLFLQGKVCKITTFFICRGFCRDPLPCSGFILYLHFAGGKAGAGPLLYKPYLGAGASVGRREAPFPRKLYVGLKKIACINVVDFALFPLL